MDVVGSFTQKSFVRHVYILAATDYFSKWAKVVALKEVKKENVVDFIRTYTIFLVRCTLVCHHRRQQAIC